MESGREGDELKSLAEVFELLGAHPGFHVRRMEAAGVLTVRAFWAGRFIARIRTRKFYGQFNSSLTLFRVDMRHDAKAVAMKLAWHTSELPLDCAVFVHLISPAGEIRAQGDHLFPCARVNALGFVTTETRIELPPGIPPGQCRFRIGVWSPAEGSHFALTQYRGCLRETIDSFRNAIILDSSF